MNDTKNAIKQAIRNKGVNVEDTDTFRSYASKINAITTGSGGGNGGTDCSQYIGIPLHQHCEEIVEYSTLEVTENINIELVEVEV